MLAWLAIVNPARGVYLHTVPHDSVGVVIDHSGSHSYYSSGPIFLRFSRASTASYISALLIRRPKHIFLLGVTRVRVVRVYRLFSPVQSGFFVQQWQLTLSGWCCKHEQRHEREVLCVLSACASQEMTIWCHRINRLAWLISLVCMQ